MNTIRLPASRPFARRAGRPAARVTARLGALLLAALALTGGAGCGGGGGGGGGGGTPGTAPTGLSYAVSPALYRVGEAVPANAATVTGTPTSWTASPPLPDGLLLDPVTGAITGTPTTEAAAADFTITAANAAGQAQTVLSVLVGPALPPDVAFLAPGFAVEAVASGLALPSKFALASDGRIFFTELKTGNVRLIDAQGTLLPTPFATLTVQGGGSHQGLLALALDPAFASNGFVYVLYSAPADGTHASDHMRLERFTEVSGVGTNQTVILDNLPVAPSNNGSDLVFAADGTLFVSLGDAGVDTNAQNPASLSGKVLRITALGAVPSDNPVPASSVWALGLRNTFGMARHPVTGGLFGVDNGPAADDELNFLQPGKNYAWGAVSVPGGQLGLKVRNWQTEIVPTALAWHFGGSWGAEYADDLFIASYDDEQVLRYEMSGTAKTDIDVESVFLTFVPNMSERKPLDLQVAPDGSLYVSTFAGIYRVTKLN